MNALARWITPSLVSLLENLKIMAEYYVNVLEKINFFGILIANGILNENLSLVGSSVNIFVDNSNADGTVNGFFTQKKSDFIT